MKIMIVTPFDSANFGAYLQAYCLKIFLEKKGHMVVHCNTRDEKYVRSLYFTDKPIKKKDKLLPWVFKSNKRFGKQKYEEFRKAHEVFEIEDVSKEDFDLVILGSDEIWNINKPVFLNLLFWGSHYSNVIAYAPSIGGAKIESFSEHDDIIKCLKGISCVLPRDVNTQCMVEKYSGKVTELVCDPTILVPVDDYYRELDIPYMKENRCLLIYAYGLDHRTIEVLKEYAKKNDLKTVSCCFNHTWCDYQVNCSPLYFSSIIRQAYKVFTTTFHGSVFCILNHADFVTKATSPKTEYLLSQMKLKNRMVDKNGISVSNIEKILTSELNYTDTDSIIKDVRLKSVGLLLDAISSNANAKQYRYEVCVADDCTGCYACLNICPKEAISVTIDSKGKTVPYIDSVKCIKCNMCKKVCPVINDVEMIQPVKCYAAQRLDTDKRSKSASGGIAAALSEWTISHGGIVYGAAVDNGIVRHKRATTLNEINQFRCSKYVQSQIELSYKLVKQDLRKKKMVLFTGTPCQIAGLKRFLGENVDTTLLYCVDIICHGVPPYTYLEQHLKRCLTHKKYDDFSFRGGEKDFHLKIYDEGKLMYDMDKFHDAYYFAFLKSHIYRENCYSCKYATDRRCSDITIGDFWGLDRSRLKSKFEGNVSVVLINNQKGQKLLDMIKSDLIIEERKVSEAVNGNPQLRRPSFKSNINTAFIRNYQQTKDFDKSILATGIQRHMVVAYLKSNKMYQKTVRLIKKRGKLNK